MLSIVRRARNFAHTCTQFLPCVKKLGLASKGLFVEPFYAVRRIHLDTHFDTLLVSAGWRIGMGVLIIGVLKPS